MRRCAALIVPGPEIHLAGFPHWPKAEAVQARRSVRPQGGIMFIGAVTLVPGKAELGENQVPLPHTIITRDLGKNGSRCNALRSRVAPDQRLLLHWEVDSNGVDQEVVGQRLKSFDSPAHRQTGGLQDIDPVDFECIGSRNGTAQGALTNVHCKHFACVRIQFLAVAQTPDRPRRVQDHSAREHRAE